LALDLQEAKDRRFQMRAPRHATFFFVAFLPWLGCSAGSQDSAATNNLGEAHGQSNNTSGPTTTLTGSVMRDTGGGHLEPVDGEEIALEQGPEILSGVTDVTGGLYTFVSVELQHYDLVIENTRTPVDVTLTETQYVPQIVLH
jgi:hypothetical protein